MARTIENSRKKETTDRFVVSFLCTHRPICPSPSAESISSTAISSILIFQKRIDILFHM